MILDQQDSVDVDGERRITPRFVVEDMVAHLDGVDREIIDLSPMSVRVVYPAPLVPAVPTVLMFRCKTKDGIDVYPVSALQARREPECLVLVYLVHGLSRREWAQILERHDTLHRHPLPKPGLGLGSV